MSWIFSRPSGPTLAGATAFAWLVLVPLALAAQGSGVTAIGVQEPGGVVRPAAAIRSGETVKLRIVATGFTGRVYLGTSNSVVLPLTAPSVTPSGGIATLDVTAATVTSATTVTITASTGAPLNSTLSRTITVYPIPKIVSAGLVPAKRTYTEGEQVHLQVKLSFKDPIGGTEVNFERPRYQLAIGGYASWPDWWGGVSPSQGTGGTRTVTVPINSDVALLPITLRRLRPQSGISLDTSAVQHWTALTWVGAPWQTWDVGALAGNCLGCHPAKFAVDPAPVATLAATYPLGVEVRTAKTAGLLTGDNPIQGAMVCVGTASQPTQFGKKTTDGFGKAAFSVDPGASVVVVSSAQFKADGTTTFAMPPAGHSVVVRMSKSAGSAGGACQ